MLDRPILAFDIETVPDLEAGREVWGVEGEGEKGMEEMLRTRREETSGRTEMLKPPYHRVITISLAWLDLPRKKFKISSFSGTEKKILSQFFSVLSRSIPARLLTWNGRGFDIPVLLTRAMRYGIPVKVFRTDGGWNYTQRYDLNHIDLMDLLSLYGVTDRLKLHEIARIMGLPGKKELSGQEVYKAFCQGRVEEIRSYCEQDVLTTLLLFLRYLLTLTYISLNELDLLLSLVEEGIKEKNWYPQMAEVFSTWREELFSQKDIQEEVDEGGEG